MVGVVRTQKVKKWKLTGGRLVIMTPTLLSSSASAVLLYYVYLS